jgi:hypothetical protein
MDTKSLVEILKSSECKELIREIARDMVKSELKVESYLVEGKCCGEVYFSNYTKVMLGDFIISEGVSGADFYPSNYVDNRV